MADDIDIEEHDLLHHPQVAGSSLQYPNIKSEPVEYEDNYGEYSGAIYNDSYPIKHEPMDCDTEQTSILFKILNEPPISITTSQTIPRNETANVQIENMQSNRIILGKKPCPQYKPGPKRKKIKALFVMLEDWGERLKTSPCFCKECQTLFATRNAIDAHNMAAHSFLVPFENPQIPDSPPQKEDSPPPNQPNHRFCTHCNTHFSDDNLLIQHLYDLIQAKQKSKEPSKAKEVKSLNTNVVGAKKVEIKPLTTNVSKQTKEVETSNVIARKQIKVIKTSNVGTPKQRREMTSNLSNGESSEVKKYLCCQICFCYFKTRWEFNGHCARSHGPCEAVEQVIDGKFPCKFCDSLHKMSMSVNRHIRINHHKDVNNLLAVKKNRVPPVNEAKYLTNTKLKCVQCNLHFKDVSSAKKHQRNHHGDRNKIVVSKRGVVMAKKMKSFLPSKVRNIDRGLPMPKNVIFKCDKCPLHFLNCLTVCCHVSTKHYYAKNSSKDKVVNGWKCPDCNRTFRAMDMHLHEMQHKQTREFKVYVAHDKIYLRVLCRCAKCNIYFEERAFIKHTKNGCGPTVDVNICNTCNIKVNNSTIHVEKHVARKLIKSDFIIIDDFIPTKIGVENENKIIIGSKPDLKRKREEGESSQKIPNKKVTLALKRTTQSKLKHIEQVKDAAILYYCSHCRLYCRKTKRRSYHLMKKCSNKATKSSRMCTSCGLRFSSSGQLDIHTKQHHQKNFSIKNYRFVCIKTMKVCTPPLPEFHKCKKCCVQYLKHRDHDCKSIKKSITCKLCKKSYHSKAFALHVLHHRYFGKHAQAPSKSIENSAQAPNKSIENTLRMKYEMLKPTWNILYVCESCDVSTDSYDDVVDHCQNHYNDMQSFDVTIKNCEQCSLNFEEKCYNKHQELHSNQEIDRSSFTILNYDYTKLLTNAWFEIFNSLPSEKMRQILKRTIYATRLVKMKLLQSGPPEYTIYKCQKCEEIVARDEISIHTEARSCRKQPPKHTCMHCGLAFANTRALDAHISIHDQHTVTVNSFRIVAFNHADEIAFNAKLRSESSISEIPQQNISNAPKKGYKCIYYRCEKCYCSTSKFSNTVRHVCPVEEETRLCHKCNNVFHRSGITLHNRKHDMTGITADHIVIKPFNVNIKPGEWRVDLTECQNCNAKFPTHLSNTHQCSTKATNSIPAVTLYRCKTCKAFFSFKENLEKHSKTCHYDTGRRKCIFKCKKCSLFMLSRLAVHYHTSQDSEPKTVIKPCKFCGWKFTPWSLQRHINLHHHLLKLTPNDFRIEVIDTQCGALTNDKKKNQKQLTNIPKYNIKPVVIKKAKEDSVESSTFDMKPVIKTYKSRKERLMDRTLKKETNTEYDEADVKTNANNNKEKEQKVELKKSSESNEKPGHNWLQYDKMKNALFRCAKCELHYLNYSTWVTHIKTKHKISRGADICTVCGLKFTHYSLKKHVLVHQGGANPHYDIVTPDERLVHGIIPTKVKDSNNDTLNANDSVVSQSGTDSVQSLVEDSSVLQIQMLDNSSIDQTQNEKPLPQPDETLAQPKKSPPMLNKAATKKYTHKIYKCGQCNVHFMAQNTCYIHMQRHTPIEAKEFIECKLCNLPFKIVSLNTHMRKHHKENFNLDEVLVEEYTNDGGKTPKIEIYYAIDKVQSRLVSTTSDEPNWERYTESNSQPSSSSSNALTNDDVVETSRGNTSDITMYTQPMVLSETVGDNTDKVEDISLINKEKKINDDVLETSHGDTSEVTMDTQPSISSETVNDSTDKIEDISLIVKEEKSNDDVVETCQGDTPDVKIDTQPSVSLETVHDNTDKIEDVNLTEENVIKKHKCQFCEEEFKSNTSKEFHESLDHLDGEKNCMICDQTFNASILNELHLKIKNNTFECCLCNERFDVQEMGNHAVEH